MADCDKRLRERLVTLDESWDIDVTTAEAELIEQIFRQENPLSKEQRVAVRRLLERYGF